MSTPSFEPAARDPTVTTAEGIGAVAASGDALTAARLANVAGALQVLKPGTATVSRAELAAELRGG